MSETALDEIHKLLVKTIKEDPQLMQILVEKKVHTGEVPSGARAPYVVIGAIAQDTGRGAGYYKRDGRRHRRRITAWGGSIDTAQTIYKRLVQILGTRLPLNGHTMVSGSFDFLAGPRQDPKTKYWGIDSEYAVRSLVGAQP